MAGLFDIAASGIQAYRSALGVTGQNIANLNTEGYRRREASLQEIAATQSDVLTRADQTGLGVRVADISRSFDMFLSGRVRATAGDDAAAQAFLASMQELENSMLPGGQDLGSFLDSFFTGLSEIAAAPGDLAPRVVALEQGRSLAAAFADTAATFEALRGAIVGQARQSVSEVNGLLDSMAATQSRVLASGQSGAASNAVLDERDRLIGKLSDVVGMNVTYNPRKDVELRLGNLSSGPVLLKGFEASGLALEEVDGRLGVFVRAGASLSETQQVVTGRLAGLLEAYAAVSSSIAALDDLAGRVAEGLNTLHPGGLTLDGVRGGAVFTTDLVRADVDAANVGTVVASVEAPDILTDVPQDLDLVFDGRAGLWRGLDAEGRIVVSGASEIRLGAVTVRLSGQPADGDQVHLSSSSGRAANMRMLISRPEDIAAAGLALASADAANLGAATVAIAPLAPPPVPALPAALDALIPNDGAALSAVRFRADGPVAVIPAGTQAVDLFSLGRQASVSFALTPGQIETLTEGNEALTLTLTPANGGAPTVHSFSLAALAGYTNDGRAPGLADLAALLNDGVILSNGVSLADLGLHAAGGEGLLTIAAASGVVSGVVSVADGTVTGGADPGNPQPSDIQIFTREGRQIAGTPMAASDIVRLLTPENGFAIGAEYRADLVNGSGGTGYRGMGVVQALPLGEAVARFDAASVGALTLTLADGQALELEDPGPAASASDIAAALNALSADTGLRAEALTRVELRLDGAGGEGRVRLSLGGAGGTPVSIDATLLQGDLSSLRNAVNARAGDTGITAALSPDGAAIVLERADGAAIAVSGLTALEASSADIAIIARQLDDRYLPQPSDGANAAGVSILPEGARVRFDGTVRLRGAGAFALDGAAEASIASARDGLSGGLITQEFSGAGRVQSLAFGIVEGIDTAEAAPDGGAASAAAARYALTVEGISVEISSSDLAGAATSAAVARALAAALREGAPVPALQVTLGDIPADGSALTLELGGQAYQLTMQQGAPILSGGEVGRLVASLDGSVLTVAAPGGALGGQALRLTGGDLEAFGLNESGPARSLTGRTMAATSGSFTLRVGTEDVPITLTEQAVSGTLPEGVAVTVADGRVAITLAPGLSEQEVRILPGQDAASLGFVVAEAEVTITDSGLTVTAIGAGVPELAASAQSLAAQRITLTNLPPEDLIVVLTGTGGARQVAARYDLDPATVAAAATRAGADVVPEPLELRIMDAQTGRVEIFERATGHSIATRTLGADGLIEAAGYRFDVHGAVQDGDRFYLSANTGGTGDGRALEAILALEARDPASGRPGFQDIYSALVTDVGARVASADRAALSTRALHDAAVEVESAQSGVNLDTEAARLMEQQQAYQALSRVLGTANDLLDTLLQSI